MKITIEHCEGYSCSAEIPESAGIYEVMEAVSNLLLTTSFNYLSIIRAHNCEAERMQEAIKPIGREIE